MRLKQTQIALSTFPYSKYSLNYALDSLERLGGHAIELYAAEPHFHIDDYSILDLHDLKHKLQLHNLAPICLTPEQMNYPINIASSNRAGRQRSVKLFETCIRYASELECPMVLMHAGYPLNDELATDAWMRSAESLSYLSRLAEQYGVTIVLEFVNVRWKTLLQNSKAAAEMVRCIHSDHLQGMIDTMTVAYGGESIEKVLDNLHGHICHCHFTDGYTDGKKLAHLVPGEGEIDLPHMLDALELYGYDGYLSIELLAGFETAPEEAMKKSLEWLRANLDPA